ncbi:MAG: bifunctional heptose 7-phosphate kinase/heptose 1-phosphate adenyltransferase [Bacteroidota bacterium]
MIGDVMIDAYLWGKVERISPEAPVPIVHVQHKENRLGGAANVALNIQSMGAKAIMCSVIGNDFHGKSFQSICHETGFSTEGVVMSLERTTTVKTRVISGGHHIVRIDEEQTNLLSSVDEELLIQRIDQILKSQQIDAIVFEDYNKGVLTPSVIQRISQFAKEKNIPVAVDPKLHHFFEYSNCTLFKPNLKELKEGLQRNFAASDQEEIKKAMKDLREQLKAKWVLVTRSEFGVLGFDGLHFTSHGAHKREIVDVSGAGDTVIAVATLALAAKWELSDVAYISNLAGGLVCEKVGVVPIMTHDLKNELIKLL